MAIDVVCRSCLKRLKFKDKESGLSRKCPRCGAEIVVPGEAIPVLEGGPPLPGRQREYIIAGVIFVVAVVGVFYGARWWLRTQESRRTPVRTTSQTTRSTSTTTVTNIVNPANPSFKSLAELLDVSEPVQIGPATLRIAGTSVVFETALNKTRVESGKTYAVLRLKVTALDAGPSFDTSRLSLMTVDGKGYPQRVTGGRDRDRQFYEAARRRINLAEISEGPVTIDVYFVLPVGLDARTCELRYK